MQLTGGTLRRSRATAYVVVGVLAHAVGRGTGTELMRQAKTWAAAHGLHRLELTVMAHNTRAIGLYERTGFTVEGRRSECLLVDGQFIDELTMATLLPTSPPPTPLPPSPPLPGPDRTRCPPGYRLAYLVGPGFLRPHPDPAPPATLLPFAPPPPSARAYRPSVAPRLSPPSVACVPLPTFFRAPCATGYV